VQVRTLKLAPDEPAYFVNSTVLASELGNVLAERGRDEGVRYAIVATYNAKSHGWSLSLRSLFGREDAPDASDVSRIAKLYGGACKRVRKRLPESARVGESGDRFQACAI